MLEISPSLHAVIESCHQSSAGYTTRRFGYQPTMKQILFFTFVWMRKENYLNQVEKEWISSVESGVLEPSINRVAFHLDNENGEIVTKLKQKDEVEWHGLLIQMRGWLRVRFQQDNLLNDALMFALNKLIEIFLRMPEGLVIEQTEDVATFVLTSPDVWKGTYIFHSPFQNYAYRIAQNALQKSLRPTTIDRMSIPLDDLLDIPDDSTLTFENVETQEEQIRQRARLKEDLAKLLTIIDGLPPKRRLVAAYTLAARSQFWQALKITGLQAPAWYPKQFQYFHDAEIAAALGMRGEKNVPPHRHYALEDIQKLAPELGKLFDKLCDVSLSNELTAMS